MSTYVSKDTIAWNICPLFSPGLKMCRMVKMNSTIGGTTNSHIGAAIPLNRLKGVSLKLQKEYCKGVIFNPILYCI